MSTMYVGKLPLTLVKRRNGHTDYVYFGQPAPTDAVEGEIERLVKEGYLVEVEGPDLVTVPEPAEPPVEPVVRTLAEMDADELTVYAEAHGIDLGRATSEDGIRAKILEAQPA